MKGDTVKEEDMVGQAQHIWTMLEDMAVSDPSAYRKFIDKHMKEGREFMKAPEPHMCVQTSYLEKEKRVTIYLNICEWSRVPAPTNDQEPIPITGGPIYDHQGSSDGSKCIGLAFNPKVLEECGKDAGFREEQRLLINLCLDYLERQQNIKVMRSYSVLPQKVTHKGSLQDLQKSLTNKTKETDDKVESDLEKAFGPAMKDSILQMTNQAVGGAPSGTINDSIHLPTGEGNISFDLLRQEKPVKKGLIEDMGGTAEPSLPEPEYEMTEKKAERGRPRMFIMRIRLPGVTSVSECELDIAKDDMRLLVENQYELTMTFPEEINDDEASAKFSSRTNILTISLPTAAQST